MGDPYEKPMKVTFEYLHSKWNTDEPVEIVFDPANNKQKNDSKIVVGLNGTGKTTLLKLIHEFYSLQRKGHSPTNREIVEFMQKWGARGVSKFSVTSEIIYDNANFYCMSIGIPDLEYIRSIFQTKKILGNLISEGRIDSEEDLNNDEKVKEIAEQGYMDGEFFEEWASLSIKLVCEFDFASERPWMTSSNSKMYVDFINGSYDIAGVSKTYEVNFSLNFNSPFGPSDYHKTMEGIFKKISKETRMEIRADEYYGLFKSPKLNTIYLDALETFSTSSQADTKLIDYIMEDSIIEDHMGQKSLEEVWSIFGVKMNDTKMRSFAEFPYIENGSEEYFYKEYDRLTGEFSLLVDRGDGIEQSVEDAERKARPEVNAFNPNYNEEDPKDGPPIEDKTIDSLLGLYTPTYHRPTNVFVCTIIPDRSTFLLHRWQNSVLYYPQQGVVYSESKDSLQQYLSRDLWRNINLENRISILSKVFNAEENQLRAFFALSDLSPELDYYLTSGQNRVFTMMEKALRKDIDMVLLDEPEVSLHIDWQRKILDLVEKYSTSKFILAATHSPDIIYHHLDEIIELNPVIER